LSCEGSWDMLALLAPVAASWACRFLHKICCTCRINSKYDAPREALVSVRVVWGAALHCWHSPPSPELQGGTCPRTWPAACAGIQGPFTDKLTTVLLCCMQLLRVRVRVEARRGPQRKRSTKRTERCLKAKRATRRDTCFS